MSTRAKAKKLARQQETAMLNTKRKLVEEAEACENLLELVPMFTKFNKNDIHAELKSFNHVPEDDETGHYEEWAFSLVKKNMKDIYEKTWGWNEEVKEAEFYHDSSRFIIAFLGKIPIGFIHFRFELDHQKTTTYIYDIHVEEELRQKGLGKYLVQAVEFITLKLHLDMVAVTVFKENPDARAFFRALKYIQHPFSPAVIDPESDHEYDHEILCKHLTKQAPAAK